jgi:hypothetical protein
MSEIFIHAGLGIGSRLVPFFLGYNLCDVKVEIVIDDELI